MDQSDAVRKAFDLAAKDMTLISVEHMVVRRRYVATINATSNPTYLQLPQMNSFKFQLGDVSNVKVVDQVISFDHVSQYETGTIL